MDIKKQARKVVMINLIDLLNVLLKNLCPILKNTVPFKMICLVCAQYKKMVPFKRISLQIMNGLHTNVDLTFL